MALQAFAQLGEEFKPLLTGCQENRRNWQIMADGGMPENDSAKKSHHGKRDEADRQKKDKSRKSH